MGEVYKMVQTLGLTLVKQEDRGLKVHLQTQGGLVGSFLRLLRIKSDEEETEEKHCGLKKLPIVDVLAYVKLGKKFERMANELIEDSEKPWLAPDADKWDAMTCEEYLQKEVSNTAARGLMRSALLAIFCLPTDQFSMLWFLANLKAEGSFEMFTVGAQSHRVLEGNGSIIPLLGTELQTAGVATNLNTVLVRCEQTEKGVILHTTTTNNDEEKSYTASRVILTIPPTERNKVRFVPELPQSKYDKEMKMGKCIKTVLAYENRWWDGTFAFGDPAIDGLHISLVADVTNEDVKTGTKEPMLATFYYGDNATKFTGPANKERRKAESIRGAQSLLCDDSKKSKKNEEIRPPPEESFKPLSVVEGDWPSVPYVEGGYANVPNPGAIVKTKMFHRELRRSFQRLHFAGTEHAERWAGYIEGAIVTGRLAGEEVADAMMREAA